MPINEKLQKSYFFFIDKESKEISFKIDDLLNFTGWSRSTLNTYLSKKWAPFLTKKGDEYFVLGIKQYTDGVILKVLTDDLDNLDSSLIIEEDGYYSKVSSLIPFEKLYAQYTSVSIKDNRIIHLGFTECL